MNTKKYIQNVMASLRKSVTQAKASNANVTKQLRKATNVVKKVSRSVRGRR
jgi:hypothetical protein